MESIIQINEGQKPGCEKHCFFCKNKSVFTFGFIKNEIIMSNDNESYIMKSVSLCEQHANGFNTLLTGEYDIDALITTLTKTKHGKLNLRR